VYTGIGACDEVGINRTRMTRIEPIDANLFSFIRDDPFYPSHPRSINPYDDLKTALDEDRGL